MLADAPCWRRARVTVTSRPGESPTRRSESRDQVLQCAMLEGFYRQGVAAAGTRLTPLGQFQPVDAAMRLQGSKFATRLTLHSDCPDSYDAAAVPGSEFSRID